MVVVSVSKQKGSVAQNVGRHAYLLRISAFFALHKQLTNINGVGRKIPYLQVLPSDRVLLVATFCGSCVNLRFSSVEAKKAGR